MNQLIYLFVSNFPLIMTMLALLFASCHLCNKTNNEKSSTILGYLFLFALGLPGLWGFVMHAFFPAIAAKYIGWKTSPFQLEVAVANLGMGVVGLFGFNATKAYRKAGAIFATCFLWGAAYGHIVQMLQVGNFAPGNAGTIFYNDIILPLLIIVLLFMSRE